MTGSVIGSTGNYLKRDWLTAAMFGGLMSCGLAAVYWTGRIGFANPIKPIAVTLGLALFVICVPVCIALLIGRRHEMDAVGWTRSPALFGIICLALTAIAGMLVYPTQFNLAIPILVLGILAFAVVIFFWLSASRFKDILLLLAFTAMFTAWTAGTAWGTRYKTPVFWEQLSDKANVHHDPLYYASMANAMRSYGVPSTALDGVPYTPYHYGSAWLNAQWSDLAGVDVLTFYSLGPTVLVAPLFFAGLLLFASEVRNAWRRTRPREEMSRALQEDWLAVVVFVGATIGFIPSTALDALAIWNRHLLISESYLTGLSLLALCCALAVRWWFSRSQTRPAANLVFLWLMIPALLVCLGFLKISLMLLALAAFLWTVLRSKLYTDRAFILSALLALALSLVTFKLVSNPAQNQGLTPFSFTRYFADVRWWPYFVLGHLFWSWVYIGIRIYEERLPTISDLWVATKEGRLLDAEIVAVVAICGFLPGELITIHGGSAVYFSDVQRWIAAPLTMAVAARILRVRTRSSSASGWRSIRLSYLATALIAIPVAITVVLNVSRAVRGAVLMNAAVRTDFYSYAGAAATGLRQMTNPHVLAAGMQKAPDYQLITSLRALDAEPREVKAKTVLFIPQADSAFWKIFKEPERCSFAPLVGPATSGMALLDGMPPASCDLTNQYDMTVYTRRTQPQTLADVAPPALCSRAMRKGFKRVVELRYNANGTYTTSAIECGVPQ